MLNKVQSGGVAGGVAGAITTILIWLLTTYGHVELPDYVAAAVGILISLLVTIATAYLTPLLPGEIEPVKPGVLVIEKDRRAGGSIV
jgi:multisubunit Na+/H+ antiporter MnhB subunit